MGNPKQGREGGKPLPRDWDRRLFSYSLVLHALRPEASADFAPDRLILRSVRPSIIKNMMVAAANGGGRV